MFFVLTYPSSTATKPLSATAYMTLAEAREGLAEKVQSYKQFKYELIACSEPRVVETVMPLLKPCVCGRNAHYTSGSSTLIFRCTSCRIVLELPIGKYNNAHVYWNQLMDILPNPDEDQNVEEDS